jgi:hypothetical protein
MLISFIIPQLPTTSNAILVVGGMMLMRTANFSSAKARPPFKMKFFRMHHEKSEELNS